MDLEIHNLSDLLKDHVKGHIINQKISRLTAPGENYGSLMLKVDVTVENSEKKEVIHTVAKCIPPNKKIQEIFNTQTTFKNEIGWYKEAIPTLLEFQKEQCGAPVADFFMQIYGTRLSLDPNSQVVDEDGVILCENLITKGFKNIDRRVGFDINQCKQIIKKLAEFHAMTLALKLKKREVFEQKIKPFLNNSTKQKEKFTMEIFEGVIQLLKENSETASLVPRVVQAIQQVHALVLTKNDVREPWATSIHTDFWVNNIMLKEENGSSPKVIILDLQMCAMGSPAADLLFFLGTSVETSTAKNNFDDIVKLYYKELIRNLNLLNANTLLFPYQSFMNELKLEAPEQYVHSMFFVAIIMAVKGAVSDATSTEFNADQELKNMFSNITEEHKKKYVYLTTEFAKRNWI